MNDVIHLGGGGEICHNMIFGDMGEGSVSEKMTRWHDIFQMVGGGHGGHWDSQTVTEQIILGDMG